MATKRRSHLPPSGGARENKLGIGSQEELDALEAAMTSLCYDAAIRQPARTVDDLFAMHRTIFGRIYDWAGEPRTIPLAKALYVDSTEATRFTAPGRIRSELRHLFKNAAASGWDTETSLEGLADKTAAFMAAYNRIHPFQEGNGRAVRAFVTSRLHAMGHAIDFRVVTEETNVRAAVAASKGDLSLRRNVLADALVPERREALAALIGFLKDHYPDWNRRQIRCATQGEAVTGRLFGKHLRSESFTLATKDALVLGHLSDLPSIDTPSGETVVFHVRRPTFPEGGRPAPTNDERDLR